MHPATKRVILGTILLVFIAIFFLYIVFFSSLASLRTSDQALSSFIAACMFIAVIIVWAELGRVVGLVTFTVCSVFIFFFLPGAYRDAGMFFLLCAAVSVVLGHKLFANYFGLKQGYKVKRERIDQDINLLRDELDRNKNEIANVTARFKRYENLSEITEKYSSSLSEADVARTIIENAYSIFGKSDRALLYRVNEKRQELYLTHSKREDKMPYVKQKKGDLYDRWVFLKRQPLLVDDIKKDFRFSMESEGKDELFSSLIAAPLISGDKVIGVLRMDSREMGHFSQYDLRLLDIVSQTASIALENAILYKRLNELAITDGLTNLYVQKFFKERLSKEIKRSIKAKTPFAVMIMDIDNFKDFNDRYGHLAGDIVLKHISSILMSNLAGGDIAARYGGEEFACMLLGKDINKACNFAEKLRKVISSTPIMLRRKDSYISVSIGISSCPQDSNLQEDLIRIADKRMYKAKEKGKNRVWIV